MDHKAQLYAEEAIRAVGRLDVATARSAIAEAFDVDHKIGALADAIYLACAEIESKDEVTTAAWNTLADAVDSPDLISVVEGCRT